MKTQEFTVIPSGLDPDSSGQIKIRAGLSNQDLDALLSRHAVGALDANLAKDVEQLLAADRDLARRLELLRKEMTEAVLLNEASGVPGAKMTESARHKSGLRAWVSTSSSSSIWLLLKSMTCSVASIASFGATEAVEYPFQSDLDAMSDDWNRVGRRLRRQVNVEAHIQASE